MENTKKEQDLFTEDDFNLFEDVMNSVEVEEEEIKNESDDVIDDVINEIKEDEDVAADITDNEDQEAEEENDEDVDINNDDEDEDEDDNSSLFTPYAKLLVDNDILSTLDLETYDGSLEQLIEAQRKEVDYHVNKYKEELPIEVKKLVDGYERGIPFDEMLKISSDRIRYDNIKDDALEDNVDLQKSVTRDYLKKTTRFSDDRINKMIERLENNAELEEESKSNLIELRQLQDVEENEALERSRTEQEAYQKHQNKILTDLKTKIETTDEIIPGVKVNKIMKDKITKNLTVPVAYDENNQPVNKIGYYSRQNPIEFEVMLNYIFEATNQFKDWGVFSKSGKSTALKELEAATRKLDTSSKAQRKRVSKDNGVDNYDLLSAISKELK